MVIDMSSLFNNFFPKSEEYPYEMSNSGTLFRKQKKKTGDVGSDSEKILEEVTDKAIEPNANAEVNTVTAETKVDTVAKPDTDAKVNTVAAEAKVDTTAKPDTDAKVNTVAAEAKVDTVAKPDTDAKVDTVAKVNTVVVEARVDVVADTATEPCVKQRLPKIEPNPQESLEHDMESKVVPDFNVDESNTGERDKVIVSLEASEENTLIGKSLRDIINDGDVSIFDLIDVTSSKVVPSAKVRVFFEALQRCQVRDPQKINRLISAMNIEKQSSYTIIDLLKIHFFVTHTFSFEVLDEEGDMVTEIIEFDPY